MTIIKNRQRPRGLTAVAVLVCLVIITMIAGAVLKVSLAQRDQIRVQERKLQADWLVEAGLQRAFARLDAEPGYTGENWEIAARELDSADDAVIAIAVGRTGGSENRRAIRVQADYPRDPTRRVRQSREVIVAPVNDR